MYIHKYIVFYESIIVGEVSISRSLTIDEALELIEFNEIKFMNSKGFDEIDYNKFKLIDSDSLKIEKLMARIDIPIVYVTSYKGFKIWKKSEICQYYIPDLFPYEHQKFNTITDCEDAINIYLIKPQ